MTDWLAAFRTIQSSEVWQVHGAWVTEQLPAFGPGISERFQAASLVTPEAVDAAKVQQQRYVSASACFVPCLPHPSLLGGTTAPKAPALECPTTRQLFSFRVKETVDAVLGKRGVISVPSAPGAAPLKGLDGSALDAFRTKALALTSIAGLCGLPQVTIPCAAVEGSPVGLGLIGPQGSDLTLLRLCEDLSAVVLPSSAH